MAYCVGKKISQLCLLALHVNGFIMVLSKIFLSIVVKQIRLYIVFNYADYIGSVTGPNTLQIQTECTVKHKSLAYSERIANCLFSYKI